MSYRVIGISVLLFFSFGVSGQEPLFSQPFEASTFMNPALAGTYQEGRVITCNRLQWPGLNGSLGSYGISADAPLAAMHGGLGINLLRQEEGSYFNRTRADIIYSWIGNLSPEFSMSMALQTSWFSYRYNPSGGILPGSIDPQSLVSGIPNENLTSNYSGMADFSVGMASSWKELYFGASIHHLTRPYLVKNQSTDIRLPLAWNLYSGVNITSSRRLLSLEPLVFSPAIIFNITGYDGWTMLGSYFIFKPLYSGLWIRSNFSLSHNSIVTLVGFNWKALRLAISYDADFLSSLYLPGNGSYELTGTLKFGVPAKRKRIKAIKCPKI